MFTLNCLFGSVINRGSFGLDSDPTLVQGGTTNFSVELSKSWVYRPLDPGSLWVNNPFNFMKGRILTLTFHCYRVGGVTQSKS